MEENSQLRPTAAQKDRGGILEKPLGTMRLLRIVTIGAGASGINMIQTLRKNLTNYEHIVYERIQRLGAHGTKIDTQDPNPSWSAFLAPAPEIEDYLCRVCEEEGLGKWIKTSHRVVEAKWDEKGVWKLKVENLKSGQILEDYCHFLLDASGILNNWKWPDIPGLCSFRGELVHSANWPDNLNYGGKKVAIIGNGSTGVQLVPALQPDVKELVHFVRSPTWIVPPQQDTIGSGNGKATKILQEVEMEGDKFTARQIEKFRSSPDYYLEFVKAVEEEVNSKFPLLIKDGELQARTFQALSIYMRASLGGDERLSDALIPKFPVGCRRLTPAVGYLPALIAENVRVLTDKIVRVVPNGIEISTGEVIEIDILICATGLDVSFRPRFPIIGRKGNLQDLWAENLPRAYMSCAVPDFPNFFMFIGPNAPVGHGSILTITEHMSRYLLNILQKCQTEGITSISPTSTALSAFNSHVEAFMPRTVWAGSCRSWFKNSKEIGPVTALHPGSRLHWFHMLEKFRGEDFEYTYEKGQRFGYLGNGFSTKEFGEEDKSWYLGKLNAKL